MTAARTRRSTLPLLALLALPGLLGACDSDSYTRVFEPEAGPDGITNPKWDGTTVEMFVTDGGCVKNPAGELCDGKDNDCDGQVDEGFDLTKDLKHCGKCNNVCNLANAYARCVSGKCQIDVCAAGYHDLNKQESDGCEYACVPSNGGTEICDGVDNDCDGQKDEDFSLTTNLKHCGSCNNACSFANAGASCVAGKCTPGTCTSGYKNIDGLDATGCEYKCPKWPPDLTDDCDGIDSDCDGKIDEDFAASACGPSLGECVAGAYSCTGGYKLCSGGTGPTTEVCNNKDDDCDGKVDETFDKLSDPRYCGGCTACSLMNAFAKCVKGVCEIAACKNGYVDLDGKASTGCEYGCTVTGPEICDGQDNDCDGKTDTADSSMLKPTGTFCINKGACKGAVMNCTGSDGWVCSYGSDVELKPCKISSDCGGFGVCSAGYCKGVVASQETLCDGLDNDCDGVVDESFKNKGKPCADSKGIGACQGTGVYICDPGKTTTKCNITKPGATAKNELCNGLDDDCDGKVDEETDDAKGKGVVDAMVHIKRTYGSKKYDYYIYTYEASRPDSGATGAGSLTTRACSKGSALPWSNVSYAAAEAACKAAGKRLCSPTEWFLACSGSSNRTYPYGNSYQSKTCNGKDYSSTYDGANASGVASGCKSQDGVMDLSGNVREWTDDPAKGSSSPEQVRGGAYDTISYGLACSFDFVVMPKTFQYPNLGFRCCSNKAP